jgi:mxaJ protein
MRTRANRASLALAVLLAGIVSAAAEPVGSDALRICADPNNLPFSDRAGDGIENKLAEMIAQNFGKTVAYTWWAQRRGFIRNTLKAGDCDLVMGVPATYDLVDSTKPYYRSAYVFVSRTDRHLNLTSITDARLRRLTIGVHLIGDDGNNTPPAHALGQQGIVENVRGYSIYGDYREPSPPSRLIEAVENGKIDVAAVWGPFGGYFAKRSNVALEVEAITDTDRFAPQQFQFDIAMGVRKGDHQLRERLNAFIDGHRSEIAALLNDYGIPLVQPQRRVSEGH